MDKAVSHWAVGRVAIAQKRLELILVSQAAAAKRIAAIDAKVVELAAAARAAPAGRDTAGDKAALVRIAGLLIELHRWRRRAHVFVCPRRVVTPCVHSMCSSFPNHDGGSFAAPGAAAIRSRPLRLAADPCGVGDASGERGSR